jgi:hypothetical protein
MNPDWMLPLLIVLVWSTDLTLPMNIDDRFKFDIYF